MTNYAAAARTAYGYNNIGASPIEEDVSPEAALVNMYEFVADLVAAGAIVSGLEPIIGEGSDIEESLQMGGTRYSPTHDGRFPFRLTVNGHKNLVEMPGLALELVRYTSADGQSICDYPRLYLNGGSWVWSIGVSLLAKTEQDYL
jgi:hypothetical protein